MSKGRVWGYRISNSALDYLQNELEAGRLRQGWGYNLKQNLTNPIDMLDSGAKRNLAIYESVKKGDYLIIPHIPNWDELTIAEATCDFAEGYRFEIDNEREDFGHIFPARIVKKVAKNNINVGSNIKSTLKCVSRFWNADRCAEEIDNILNKNQNELLDSSSYSDGWNEAIREALNNDTFANNIFQSLRNKYNAADWEFILRDGLKSILPDNVIVETTWNKEEALHGCDIFVKIPGIFATTYVVAIQVKDYKNTVSSDVIEQVNRVDCYLKENEPDAVLVDKYVIIIEAEDDDNEELIKAANECGVKIVFKNELKYLLADIAKAKMGDVVKGYQ